ncbi:ATP-dependent helicase HrpB [Aurantimonas sp. MSK8Z-1]|uniref:ATP-dependent helicase HrpB n=1 Tax=Mangrovibrevibacter kandeliae TaxID=2968473 RepID=UPI002117FD99|nr:ATP-dependent helicase HrpB [Aurantimonas sp. MSK8Z-1]MCW4115094.1 ATP-dependent helicase HrpB [Aurantimonas sp. MSK8Z-1]
MSPTLPELPVSAVLAELGATLEEAGRAVLVAPPGAGKTTLVPLHLLDAPFASGRKIILIEPRRLAARAAARRMASLLGEQVGATVGWRMRLDTKVSARTRIEVVTEGVFTRMILDDPELAGVAAVLFDEFHERSLDGDFGLALALDVRAALRDDLRLLVMSATLDGARVARLLGDAAVVESAGRAFPVAVRHRERPGTQSVEDAVAEAVLAALVQGEGSILCFLPGQREIERVAERLEPRVPADVRIAPLYGAMEGAAQDLAIRPAPAGSRKVVLATSIAETSLTIDGVTIVIDCGLRRAPVFEPATGLSRLETVRISQAAADQRAGRAGRTAPGTAIRLWRAEQTAALPRFDTPEILSTDLSGLVLDCTAWGVTDPRALAFLDPPPEPALAEARMLLAELGALGSDGRLTETGERMRQLPLPARLAAMVATADTDDRRTAAELAVLLTERGLGGTAVDLAERLSRFRSDRSPRAKAAAGLIDRLAGGRAARGGPASEPGALLALAYPDRIAVARGARGSFVLANGRGGVVDELSPLAAAPLIVVAELQGQARAGRILSAAALSRETLETRFAERITVEDTVTFDAGSGQVRARRVRRIGRATLAETPLPNPPSALALPALMAGVRQIGLDRLIDEKAAASLLRRLRFLAAAYGTPWPDLSDEALLATLEDWLAPYAPGATRLSDLKPMLGEALRGLVPADLSRQLDRLAPTHYDAPSGSTLPIRYDEDQPVLAVRVQELFGLRVHPSIADGRLPLTLELLSPAHRPIQITRDLPGFWAGSWADVRADLRGRYPKHVWPEDPASAQATNRAKPRGT